jgi:hypothetical protein
VHGKEPPVTRLAIHLPYQQLVYWAENATAQQVQRIMKRSITTLTDFFEYNGTHPPEQAKLYENFPKMHVWTGKHWKLREQDYSIGRLYHANPIQGEYFYLRMLLTIKLSPKSFEDLRTVNGVEHPTFQAACYALGLPESDQEWIDCFTDAAGWAKGKGLQILFAWALVYGRVTNPGEIWTQFQQNLCDDLERMIEVLELSVPKGLAEPHFDLELYLLQRELQSVGKDLETYSLPSCSHDWNLGGGNPETMHVEHFDPAEEEVLHNSLSSSLNSNQLDMFNISREEVEN